MKRTELKSIHSEPKNCLQTALEALKSAENARFAAGSESPLREGRRGDVFRGWGRYC